MYKTFSIYQLTWLLIILLILYFCKLVARFSPYEKLHIPMSHGGSQNKDRGGPRPLDKQGQRQVSGLPAVVYFSAMVSQSPLRQLTLGAHEIFLVLKYVDTYKSHGLWLPLSVLNDSPRADWALCYFRCHRCTFHLW